MLFPQGNLLFRRNPSTTCPRLRVILDKAQSLQAPHGLGPQSWQVCLAEGCVCRSSPRCSREYPEQQRQGSVPSHSLVCYPEPPTRPCQGAKHRPLVADTSHIPS